MNNLQTLIKNYLQYCSTQKRLDEKTLKAYRIDLRQFSEGTSSQEVTEITSEKLEEYIAKLHKQYKPKTVKRKIASLKAFFHYLEYREIIDRNPFNKIQVRFREPVILPKTIPLHVSQIIYVLIKNFTAHIKENHCISGICHSEFRSTNNYIHFISPYNLLSLTGQLKSYHKSPYIHLCLD